MNASFVSLVLVSAVMNSIPSAAGEGEDSVRPYHSLISHTASERGTAGVDNKIVSANGKTHVVWQDSTEQGYRNIARTLDRATGKWSKPVTLGPGVDNHARPCMTIDSKGYLHVVLSGHNTPLRYLRSESPNSTAEWVDEHTFGRGTYTSIICSKGDVLVVSARPSGVARDGSGIDLYIRKPGDKGWTHKKHVLRTEPQYTGYVGYNTSIAWGTDGTSLHLAADVYEGTGVYDNRGTNQAVVYMVSDDYGDTWRKSDSSVVGDPPYPKDLDVIYLSSRKREQKMPKPICRIAGLVVDKLDTPHVLYTQHEPNPGEAHLVKPDGKGAWIKLPLAKAIFDAYPGYGALGARGALGITEDGRIQMLIPITPIEGLKVPGDPHIDQSAVRFIFITTADGGKTYTFHEPLPEHPGQRFVPSVEKPSGHHVIASDRNAAFMYIEGIHRYPRGKEVIQNSAYFVELPHEK